MYHTNNFHCEWKIEKIFHRHGNPEKKKIGNTLNVSKNSESFYHDSMKVKVEEISVFCGLGINEFAER